MHNLSLITKKHQTILKERRATKQLARTLQEHRVAKDRGSDCHDEETKKTKEPWNLNAVSDSELEPSWTRKGRS